ncbi:MAG TPA: chemotaxis protein CheA [Myxococcota bacterium]|nr:chemotaxis protein CheA [Myxococcota bacterium]
MDLAKYRAIFVEEAAENFAEMGRALLALEKNPSCADSIDTVFRMAHSVKGMAASLDYTHVTELAHRLEDRMHAIRDRGRVSPGDEIALLFKGLEALEAMVETVKNGGDPSAGDAALLAALRASAQPEVAPAESGGTAPSASPQPSRAAAGAPGPGSSVRVQAGVLDRFLSTVGEVILCTSQVRTAAAGSREDGGHFEAGLDRMERVVGELQRRALDLRTTPILRIVEPLPRAAREIARRAGKQVEVEIAGSELELDRSILDRLSDPLVHLVRNAVDHGIEMPSVREGQGKPLAGRIAIDARREKGHVTIEVRDDGAGIDLEKLRARAVEQGIVHADLAADLTPAQTAALVFHAGLSTAAQVTEVSGRGVGMDAVRATVEALGGEVEIETQRGRGTATRLRVPITAAVQRVLLVEVGGETLALPIAKVERILELPAAAIERSGADAFALIDDELVPVLDLAARLRLGGSGLEAAQALVLTEVRGERVALCAARVLGQQQIYVKPVPELLAGVRALAGFTILGDGRPVFLLDPNQVA